MPNIVTLDSLRQMMPESALWPQGATWGLHDFCLTGAQGGRSFRERIEKSYGGADNVADWVTLAQFVNYDGYRAMFEAQSKNRMGLLIWMSHPAWPSLRLADLRLLLRPDRRVLRQQEGRRAAAHPVEPGDRRRRGGELQRRKRHRPDRLACELLNMDGTLAAEKTATVDSAEDSVTTLLTMEYPASVSPVHFLRLKLTRGDDLVSENFYWRGTEPSNFRALRTLPKVAISASTKAQRAGDRWILTTELQNTGQSPALMVRVKPVREKAGDRILPAIFSDNYIALMPGEKHTITVEFAHADTRGELPRLVVEGFNVK